VNARDLENARLLAGTARNLLAVALRQVEDIIADNPEHYGTLQLLRGRIGGIREHVVELCRILDRQTPEARR